MRINLNSLIDYIILGDVIIDDETLKKFAYVNISSYRVKVMKTLKDDVKIPTVIAKDCDIVPNHISKVLSELKDVGAVECLNEEARKGRLYRLTDLGDEIVDNLE